MTVAVLAVDAGVTHDFPLPPVAVPNRVSVVHPSHMSGVCPEIARQHLRGVGSGQPRHFDFDTEILISQLPPPSSEAQFSADACCFMAMKSRTDCGTVLI